jgi:uncharacterized protein
LIQTLSVDAMVRSIGMLKDQPLLVFVGAGASMSSGMPSATQCIWEWKRSIFLTNNPGLERQFDELSLPSVRQRIQRWLDAQRRFPNEGDLDEYSVFIEECYARADDRRRYFQDWVSAAKPGLGYQLLAELARRRLVSSVWTTNFDGLVARAATLDGYLHAIAIGPTSLMPQQWMPGIWGEGDSMMPPVKSIEQLNRILSLIMRHFNSIIAAMEQQPREIYPIWCTSEYRGKDYDDAEGWAYGFTEGMKLCWNDWEPLLHTTQGQAWYRPIGLLGDDNFSPEQDQLTKTPAKRGKLALQIPEAVVAMYEYWLPYRHAVYERHVAKSLQRKVGRNEDCPCGSGKKYKTCCGAASVLH